MTEIETVEYLSDKMEALLEEARTNGYCFTFNVEAGKHANYKEGQPITLFSDDETFGFSVEDYQGDD